MIKRWTMVLAACCLLGFTLVPGRAELEDLRRGWSDDPVWYDGLCEIATYEAERVIYGEARPYVSRIFTNKERYDRRATTKASGGDGLEVFKHHRRDDVPTENYTYHYSTMAYVDTRTLGPVKLEMGSQEDCGASFKRLVVKGRRVKHLQSSYFPDEGLVDGVETIQTDRAVFVDALTLVLRGFPFGEGAVLRLDALPSVMETHLTEVESEPMVVREVGVEVLDLPIGAVEAYHLEAEMTVRDGEVYHFWFATEGGGGADDVGRHVLVQHRGPWGSVLRLASVERRAYWR